jgi:hypothetical protein
MSIAHTRVFYTMLMEDDHSALLPSSTSDTAAAARHTHSPQEEDDPLGALLCPDCRIQNKYGDQARGETGQAACVRRLRRLQAALLPLPAATRQGMLIPVSSRQTLIYFSLHLSGHHHHHSGRSSSEDSCSSDESEAGEAGAPGRRKGVTLGIGLEWERGVVTGVVLRHVPRLLDPDSFLSLVMYSRRQEELLRVLAVELTAEEAREGQITGPSGGSRGGSSSSSRALVSVRCSPPLQVPQERERQAASCGGEGEDEGGEPLPQPRRVHFGGELGVVLVPPASGREERGRGGGGGSDCFYSPQDYQRFSRQRDCEVSDAMREEGLGREEALRFLYLLEGTAAELLTDRNCHLSEEEEEEEREKREDGEIDLDRRDEEVDHPRVGVAEVCVDESSPPRKELGGDHPSAAAVRSLRGALRSRSSSSSSSAGSGGRALPDDFLLDVRRHRPSQRRPSAPMAACPPPSPATRRFCSSSSSRGQGGAVSRPAP